MTNFAELLAKSRKMRKPRKDLEHELQCSCVTWFRLQYPSLRLRLFAVPNGGARSRRTASMLKAEGVVSGVSDLILLKPNREFSALLIEMKINSANSRQSATQKAWQGDLTSLGEYKYVVCRSVEDFIREVKDYISDT